MTEVTHQESSFSAIIPDEWKSGPVLMTAYRIINYGDQVISAKYFQTDFNDIRVVWVFGEMSYEKFTEDFDFSESDHRFNFKLLGEVVKKSGAWIIFIQPYDDKKESEIKQVLSSFCGVLIAINGRCNAYQIEFQHILNPNNTITRFSNIFMNTAMLEKVIISNDRLSLIKNIGDSIQVLEVVKSSRVQLALHWFEKSIRTTGIDSFLNLWIALEALSMPKTTDIRMMKERLSKIYEIDLKEVENMFCIGKIFGLRSKIVHDGLIFPINEELLDIMQGLFTDLLIYEVGLTPIYKAKHVISLKHRKINELLKF